MKALLTKLWSDLASASTTTKALIGAALVLVLGVGGYTTAKSNAPHFKLLYSGLDASHAAAVQSALAEGGIRYQVSQPPAPFVVHVDESQFYPAQNLVALAGALEVVPEGIQTGATGASSVFLSAPERAQTVLKREWQELEKQLEELDFVNRAHVSTSIPDPSPFRRGVPMTVAVTLGVRGGEDLSKAQAKTVAKLVRYRFNVPPDNVVISDQSGKSVWDGASDSDLGQAASEILEHKAVYDAELTRKTNLVLDRIFGDGMAYVVVNSEWTFDTTEIVRETIDPKNKAVVSQTTNKTSTPQATNGYAGAPSGDESSASQSSSGPAAAASMAETSETKTTTLVGKSTEHVRQNTPLLERLSVSLFLDDTLKEQKESLESSVKTSVGFVAERDAFSSLVTPFASIARDETGKRIPPPVQEPAAEPSPWLEILLQRGIEIAAALAFLFVLFKTLKGGPKKAAARREEAVAQASDPQYVEMLAKTEVEELVRTDPEKVGAILSRWAAQDDALVRAGR